MVILIFLPALIFESAYNSDYYTFKRQVFKILLLAGPVLLLCTVTTAAVMLFIFKFDTSGFDFWSCCLFGAIISATDPVAVVALLKELGVSKRISTLIEGESLLNDGTAYVVFLILLEVVADPKYKAELTVGAVIGKFFYLALVGPLIGLLFGKLLSMCQHFIHN
jgi:NhaP-type Na+/H+ or K+/H+ antiporter